MYFKIVSLILFGVVFVWGGFVALGDQLISFYVYDENFRYDTSSDDSIQKYLGFDHKLNDMDYIPQDLVSIESDFTANNSTRFLLRKEASKKFANLAWAFWKKNNGDRLFVTSAYRSGRFQSSLIKNGCPPERCAQIGTSEHQLGLAIDFGVVTRNGVYVPLTVGSRHYNWLMKNASDFGFHNTYQKGIEIDGQMREPWHWRYLGEELAKHLSDEDKTFSEWFFSWKE